MPEAKNTMETIEVPSLVIENTTQTAKADADDFLSVLEEFVIESDEDFEWAAQALREIKTQKKALTGQRTDLTKDLSSALEKIRKLFRPAIQTLDKAEKLVKKKIAEATRSREEERQKALSEAGKAAMAGDAAGASEAMQRARDVQGTPEVEGISMRTVWNYRVTDMSKVPLAFVAIDDDAVKAVLKRDKGETQIPGIEVFAETSVAARVK